jgi:hypothetical protein
MLSPSSMNSSLARMASRDEPLKSVPNRRLLIG